MFFVAQDRYSFSVVMTRIDADLSSEALQYRQALILRFGVSAGQIRPSAAADQQRITGKNAIFEQQTRRVLGVAGCVNDIERCCPKRISSPSST